MKDLIEALTIFAKYAPDACAPTHCEHDELHITCVAVAQVSAEDLARLAVLTFRPARDHDGFYSFRFGSS